MKKVTKSVIKLSEIPMEFYNDPNLVGHKLDTYAEFHIEDGEHDKLSLWLIEKYPNIAKKISFLIHIDVDLKSRKSKSPRFQIDQIVYHRDVYDHNEPLRIIGITEDKLCLEGDYSGGTNGVKQASWLPIKGTSRIKNHAYKAKVRQDAINLANLNLSSKSHGHSLVKHITEMIDVIKTLTRDVELNPEF